MKQCKEQWPVKSVSKVDDRKKRLTHKIKSDIFKILST